MHSNTRSLKNRLATVVSDSERLRLLKDAYKGEECFILTAGPSLSALDHQKLREVAKEKLVICVKQTYDVMEELCDFHLINSDNYQVYNFSENDQIIKMKVVQENSRQKTPRYKPDVVLKIDQTQAGHRERSLAHTKRFEDHLIEPDTKRPWGPGIMYELGIYLPVLLGCSKITVLGWDMGSRNTDRIERFYEKKGLFTKLVSYLENEQPRINGYRLFFRNLLAEKLFFLNPKAVLNKPLPTKQEAIFISESTPQMYEWLQNSNIELQIISDRSLLAESIPRVTLDNF